MFFSHRTVIFRRLSSAILDLPESSVKSPSGVVLSVSLVRECFVYLADCFSFSFLHTGTPAYLAPEVLKNKGYNKSLGNCLFLLFWLSCILTHSTMLIFLP